jgi:hypothetical protein
MRPLLTLLLAATALFTAHTGAPPPGQRPAQQDGPSPRRSTPLPVADLDARLVDLQGAWQLVRVDSPSGQDPTFRASGMMLVTDGFLSIELHMGMLEAARTRMFETYFQSGVHRIELDHTGQLILTSVIGAEVDEAGLLAFEEPGQRRLYRFDVENEQLVLTNLQRRARLIFMRVRHSPAPRDIYGREVQRPAPAPPGRDEQQD